jgi:glycosyltransferase involved in cell wall biosynthesis
MIKLYGIGNGYGSRAQVTRGFRETIESLGMLTEFAALDRDDGSFERRGDNAPIAIMTGPLEWSMQISPMHKRRIALVAPNATKIPHQMMAMIKAYYTDIIVPSHWCMQAVEEIDLPVHVVPHGVFSDEIALADQPREELHSRFENKEFSLVHFSTSNGSRKGTIELLEGFQIARSRHPEWKLRLVMILDQMAQLRVQSLYDGSMDEVAITSRLDGPFRGSGMDPRWFANGMRLFHAVIQPSRGEAFGLIPLEARAAGVPPIMTCCSGHREHFAVAMSCTGSIPIEYGPDAPIEDCDGAMAPSVSPESIADAIESAIVHWKLIEDTVSSERKNVLETWDWKKVTAPFILHAFHNRHDQ